LPGKTKCKILAGYFDAGTMFGFTGIDWSVTTFAPTSFSKRWNSGEAMMIVPAAARSRSTASGGRTNDVGC
jgi:hypothetical protein